MPNACQNEDLASLGQLLAGTALFSEHGIKQKADEGYRTSADHTARN